MYNKPSPSLPPSLSLLPIPPSLSPPPIPPPLPISQPPVDSPRPVGKLYIRLARLPPDSSDLTPPLFPGKFLEPNTIHEHVCCLVLSPLHLPRLLILFNAHLVSSLSSPVVPSEPPSNQISVARKLYDRSPPERTEDEETRRRCGYWTTDVMYMDL